MFNKNSNAQNELRYRRSIVPRPLTLMRGTVAFAYAGLWAAEERLRDWLGPPPVHGWTALTISQQSVTVECESGAACESSQQRPRNGRVGLDSEY